MTDKLKKTVLLTIVLCMAICFCACTNNEEKVQTTTAPQITEQGSDSASAGLTYYDKNGTAYDDMSKLPYYDKNGNVYYYVEDLKEPYFVDKSNNHYDGFDCYIDSNGDFIIDTDKKITIDDDGVHASDADGNKYYPAATVRWDVDGNPIAVFGFGEIIE